MLIKIRCCKQNYIHGALLDNIQDVLSTEKAIHTDQLLRLYFIKSANQYSQNEHPQIPFCREFNTLEDN